ncbi:hypothetical protein VTO73DRAFT_14729 [Trametes versicolor]
MQQYSAERTIAIGGGVNSIGRRFNAAASYPVSSTCNPQDLLDVAMAKSKNHTNHNQSKKAHRNGIKTPKSHRTRSMKGVCAHFALTPSSAATLGSRWLAREKLAPSRRPSRHDPPSPHPSRGLRAPVPFPYDEEGEGGLCAYASRPRLARKATSIHVKHPPRSCCVCTPLCFGLAEQKWKSPKTCRVLCVIQLNQAPLLSTI